ncbi:MAG: (d)CMP kinase [Bacteroidetes bacterium]|nr:(d)CMP kinase [Bacteroidota bacterium]
MSRSRLIIAIDGPAASGKSTTARLVAERLGYVYIDTGAMYRALTYAALRAGVDPGDQVRMERLADECVIELHLDDERRLRVFLNGRDVSGDIRTPEVTANVSMVSAYAGVRRRLVELQRNIGAGGGIVMDGRDIGTVVFPDADVKIFMVADIRARAERRKAELHTLGNDVTLTGLALQLEERDRLDSTRDVSPLRKADDAVEIDTSSLSIEEQVERVVGLALERAGE